MCCLIRSTEKPVREGRWILIDAGDRHLKFWVWVPVRPGRYNDGDWWMEAASVYSGDNTQTRCNFCAVEMIL